MIRIQNAGLVAALATGMMFTAATAQAEMIKFTTALTGAAEVPPTDSAATGTAEVTLDTESKTVTWTYTHDGLSGDMTAAHIHGPATATEAAGPVVDTMTETMAGSAPITDAQAAELLAGMYYFNIHTEKFPDGEIRGQLVVMK
ncbi:CHRD domain-containing protein [Tabrizicola sp.]|uniref:CHRD domain-containing protein n=1 Tax=Tabrizicola sp. TaxID=2005166 RepID=UPI00286BE4F0|nr:CHRD domain-containing protein [Tabrizicola sp.]